jgi:hypothetical protein
MPEPKGLLRVLAAFRSSGLLRALAVDDDDYLKVNVAAGSLVETPHVLLDGSINSDTDAGAVVLGDLIVGATVSGNPKWKRLARGSSGQVPVVQADGTIAYETLVGGYTQGARVYNNANIATVNGTYKILTFNTEQFDTDDIHEGITNPSRLTCKTAGKYFITANILWQASAAGTGRQVGILLNNATEIALINQAFNTAVPGFSMATIYDLSVNDYVEVRVIQDSGGALNVLYSAISSPVFAMQRIG